VNFPRLKPLPWMSPCFFSFGLRCDFCVDLLFVVFYRFWRCCFVLSSLRKFPACRSVSFLSARPHWRQPIFSSHMPSINTSPFFLLRGCDPGRPRTEELFFFSSSHDLSPLFPHSFLLFKDFQHALTLFPIV